jgi:hypothetical protein
MEGGVEVYEIDAFVSEALLEHVEGVAAEQAVRGRGHAAISCIVGTFRVRPMCNTATRTGGEGVPTRSAT